MVVRITRCFPENQQPLARFRFNERRTGIRAATGVELTLLGKPTAAGVAQVTAAISARGVYDLSRRFVGTIGLIREVSEQKMEQPVQHEIRHQQQRTDDLRTLVGQMTELAQRLQQPLSTLLQEAQQLSDKLRESGIIERLGALIDHAAASARLGEQLSRAAGEAPSGYTINRLLEELLSAPFPEYAAGGLLSDLTAALPPYLGDREKTTRLLRRLLSYAGSFLAAVGRSHQLAVKTSVDTPPEFADAPTLFPLTPARQVQVDIIETEQTATAAALPARDSPLDAGELFRLAGELGATLDISAPAQGPLRITVRFPATSFPSPPQPSARLDVDVPVAAQTPAVTPPPPPRAGGQATTARTDRRSYARVPTTLQAKVHSGSSEWDGTVVNLSVGGACIQMPGDFPSIALQEAHVTVTTSVATLELSGFIYERVMSTPIAQPSLPPASHLIVVLNRTPQIEAAVLASLITAAHERSLLFTLDIRLAAVPIGNREPGRSLTFDLTDDDRRETVRIPLALPARLEADRRQEPAGSIAAQVTNISRSGAALLIQARPEDLQGSLRIHFAPAHRGEAGSHEPAPDTILPAHVIWSAPDPTASSALHVPGTDFAARVGLRFDPLTPYAERELNRVIRQYMRAQRGSETSAASPIVSVPRECRNARGQAISITDDHLLQLTDASRPIIVIAPGYGQIALDYAALAYYLAEHHFRILRYDPTNHLGNSDGELQHTTLRSMQHDLDKVIEFVRDTWPQAPVLVIASDLGARAALKSAAQIRPLDLLLLVNPAVDMRHLLMTAHGHDLIADYQFGLRRGVCNVLGLNVNVDQFVGDLIAGRCVDLDSTLEDLRLIRSPLCIATSPAVSTALPPADLPHAFMTALGAHTKLVNISTPLTERRLDVHGAPPAAFKQLLKQIGSVIPVHALPAQQEISAHPFVVRQQRIEQEYTFLRHEGSQINREALCAAHVAQLTQLGNLHEYRKLLDDLYGLMSPLDSGYVLVDAGVGQSDLTRAALVNHTYRAGQASPIGRRSPLMIGVGRSAGATRTGPPCGTPPTA